MTVKSQISFFFFFLNKKWFINLDSDRYSYLLGSLKGHLFANSGRGQFLKSPTGAKRGHKLMNMDEARGQKASSPGRTLAENCCLTFCTD